MSQISNKVKWCLNKAQRELAEQGIHRGLIKNNPNLEIAEKHILKAEHNINAALYLRKGGFSDWSTSAFFYCVYHCFLAIIRKFGYESRNQECTLALVELLIENKVIDLDMKFVNVLKISEIDNSHHNIMQMREQFQYGVSMEFKEDFLEYVNMCKEVIDATREIVYKK